MKRLYFAEANNLSALDDELTVALPSLAPMRDAEGLGTPVMRVEGLNTDIWLTVPDDADEAAIAAVVQAHDGTISQPDPWGDRKARIAELLQINRSSWTSAQLREIAELCANEITG